MTLKYRKDYVAPHYHLPKTELDFTLDPTDTVVSARLTFTDYQVGKPLVLNGEYMRLTRIVLDGRLLSDRDYELTEHTLTIHPQHKKFVLETTVHINPTENTRLFGLYASDGGDFAVLHDDGCVFQNVIRGVFRDNVCVYESIVLHKKPHFLF